jgi:hypothetical protein
VAPGRFRQLFLRAPALREHALRARGSGCLQRQRAQSLPHLVLEVAGPLDLDLHPTQLQLGPVSPILELAEPRGLLDQRTALGGLRGEDLLDASLPDDRVQIAAEPDVCEELDHVGAPNASSVHEVLAFAVPPQAPRDRELGELDRRLPVLVVHDELDLAEVGAGPAGRARVENVVRLLSTQLGRAQAARRPDDRVGDVRLPGAIRANDDGDARLQANLDRIGERLEAAQLDGPEIQGRKG